MKISDYDYSFPSELIAIRPPKIRGQSRLIVLDRKNGNVAHRKYNDLVDYLEAGDVLVLNDTKVIKARLVAKNAKDNDRELLLIERHGHELPGHHWKAVYRGKLVPGEKLNLEKAVITVKELLSEGIVDLESSEDLLQLADQYGSVPLPPYMKRQADEADIERYQTVFAKEAGSVAAPTASLNFTEELAEKLRNKGVIITYLTLHVGLGTFLPIRTDDVEEHQMHSEYFEIPAKTVEAIQSARKSGRKVTAIGTTVTRALEFANSRHPELVSGSKAKSLSGEANIFIYPGYQFKVIDQLVTNFHAPRSTVLMLAAAFAAASPERSRRTDRSTEGWDNLKSAYQEAIKQGYYLLSYGDSMLITSAAH